MKVKSEDILKPGAKLEAKRIDFNDPEVKAFVESAKLEQRILLKLTHYSQKKHDAMRKVITI